ncbi:MAG: hypothetical protein AB2531_12180, partial [Candidatus Thiodiazotropha sp.]
MKLSVLAASLCLAFSGAVVAGDQKAIDLNLSVIGQYQTGIFDDSAAEIVAHDPRSQRLFAINASKNSVDVLDINDPTNPQLIGT